MINKIKLITFLALLSACSVVYAQKDSVIINRNIKALQKYATANPIEKVHLHLDRSWYFLGDTVWFKAYVVAGPYHRLSAIGSTLYAELIDEKDSVLNRLTLKLEGGMCSGDFVLPLTYKGGAYRLRAYTRWMRNAGPDYFYDQHILVGAPTATTAAVNSNLPVTKNAQQNAPDNVDVQFFPEGGDLVNGLRSKVAFKAVNKNGMAEQVQGVVIDMEGNEVASFDSQHLGMGLFPIAPQKGKQYQAKITCADGSKITVQLPRAKDAGFTLSVNNSAGDSLYVKIAANDELFQTSRDSSFYLIAQSAGKYYYAAARKLANKVFVAALSKSRFPSGITQFTLFSQNGEPLNERIVFIQNTDQLNLALSAKKQSYAPGEKVAINLQANDDNGTATVGAFSVSVVDQTKAPVNELGESTIFSDLLLKSELAGHIEDPNYYFINTNDQTRADLDLLMLTQGYHRFEWKKILSAANPVAAFEPEIGLNLSGTVTTLYDKPIPGSKVVLSSVKYTFEADTLTDANGKFSFVNLNLPDTTKVVVNAKRASGKDNNVKVSVSQPTYAAVTKTNEAGGYIGNHYTEEMKQAITAWNRDSLKHTIQLKEVSVKSHTYIRPDYTQIIKSSKNLNGPGQADQVFLADDLIGCAQLADCLAGKLHGVTFSNGIAYSIRALRRHLTGANPQMAIYVDGAKYGADQLSIIIPTDVVSIEVLTSAQYLAIYGSDAYGGALVITTKNGSEIPNKLITTPDLITYQFKGFYKARTFYSPKYDASKSVSTSDARKTVYWNPDIITDGSGKTSFEYFNAGSKGNYRVVIEGINGDGKLGRQVLNYKVE